MRPQTLWTQYKNRIVILVGLIILVSASALQAATAIDVGYKDHSYPSDTGSNDEVTAEKPESKLWWNDGYWWASMWSTSGDAYHIYKLDWATQNWSDTGIQLDDRSDSRADVLWDGQKLYVVSHLWTGSGTTAGPGERGELFRYSYSAGTYTLDSGFPIEVSDGKSEALVIDKDTSGMLWVTYVQGSQVWVNHSQNGDDADWVGSYVLPVGDDANVDDDDLSSLVAFDGKIGVMWSDQSSGKRILFATHTDGTDPTTWQKVAAYTASGDDHINVKSLQSDPSGKVFAVVKTSKSATLIVVLVCEGGSCTSASDWAAHIVYGSSDGSPTRPALLIDTSNRDLYVFSRVDNNIYYKRSDIDNVQFSSGWGEQFIISATDQRINDPTTTKQTVNNTTGIAVLASDRQSNFYFHNCIELAGTSNVCLEANPDPAAVTDVSIMPGGIAGVTLDWTPLNGTQQLWQGAAPYFEIDDGDPGTIMLNGDVSPPTTVDNVTGDPAMPHYFLVINSNVNGNSPPSNRTGEFDFSITSGS